MTTEKFDVVVIGAGLGGLSAAGYMAKAGKSVLVLEHHTVPGGYASEFRRGHYRFDVALHVLDGAGPGNWAYSVLSDLVVLDKVTFHRLDPFYTARFPEHEITVSADPLAYEAELVRLFPHEADGIRDLIDAMIEVLYETRRYIADGQLGRRPPLEEIPAKYPRMLAAMTQSWGDFMTQHLHDSQLQAVFSTLWPYGGLPPSTLSAAIFIFPVMSFHLFGAYYPEGGSQAVNRALEKTIKAYGGEIRYRQTVNHIEIRDGMAVAVETEKGLRVEADIIISNANPPDTMLKFVGREHLPEGYVRKVERARDKPAISSLVVYLGLERDLLAEGWPHHALFIMDNYDHEVNYQAVMAGRFKDSGLVIIHHNHADPTCAPEGCSVISIMTLAPWDYANQWGTGGDLTNYSQNPHYLKLKQDAGEKLLTRAEKHLPGLREAIKHMEVATPLTNYRYSLNPGGSIYGLEPATNAYLEPLSEKTPILNLFMTGAWIHGGGMCIALLSGQITARTVRAYLDGEEIASLMGIDFPLPEEDDSSPAEISDEVKPMDGEIPAVTLTAAGSGRKVALREISVPAVLIFHTQETETVGSTVNQAIREKYALASSVMVVNVTDLHRVPRPFRKIAERVMRKSYQETASRLPQEMPAEEYVVILPDWDGAVTRAVGLRDVNETAGVIVLDHAGDVIGVYQGDDPASVALALLAKAGV